MNKPRWIAIGLVACLAAACGDDADDAPSDSGVPESGTGSSGKGGAGGSTNKGGAGGASARGGQGGQGGQGNAGGKGGSGEGDQAEKITIRFKAKIGDQDLACGKTYKDVGSKQTSVEPADFRFFVQDIALIDDNDKEVPVKLDVRAPWQLENVALLDFEDGSGACVGEGNKETNVTLSGSVPKGTYKGITFSNGVPEELNHGDPTTFEDPLKTYASMSWSWLLGFRFAIVSVVSQTEADGGAPGGLLHLGSTGCSNTAALDGGTDFNAPPEIECSKHNRNKVELTGYKVGESVIIADAAKLFEKTDVSVESDCHSGGDACPSIFDSIGVDFANGQAHSSQSFYRLE